MRSLSELLDPEGEGFRCVHDWVAGAIRPVEILPPSDHCDEALVATQVTTRSPMGAVVHQTGGILIDRGWLRILGSGHPRIARTLPGWNAAKSEGFSLVADDAVGGFFAINGGALGADVKGVYYFAPDSLEWEALNGGYSDFLSWACTGELDRFYEWIRWPGWEDEVSLLHGDRCWTFYPFLFTKEGAGGRGRRADVPIDEVWRLHVEMHTGIAAPGRA